MNFRKIRKSWKILNFWKRQILLLTLNQKFLMRILPSLQRRRNKMPIEKSMERIVALAKTRGFVFPGSDIYGGLANAWDFGPLGVQLKNNVKQAWWKKFVQENPYNVGVDCAI